MIHPEDRRQADHGDHKQGLQRASAQDTSREQEEKPDESRVMWFEAQADCEATYAYGLEPSPEE